MGSAEVQGKLWGHAPADWATLQESQHFPLFEAMLDAAQLQKGANVLDAGCGGGSASVIAAQRGLQVTALDASEAMIAFASSRVPTGQFHVGDIETPPFDDNSFDGVIAPNCIQYAENRMATLRALGRVCKVGQRIVVALFAEPEKVTFRAMFAAVRDALPEPPTGEGPFGLSAPGKLEGLMEDAGLTIVESGEVDCPFTYPDFDIFWKANSAAGPFRGAMTLAGDETLKSVLREAAVQFQDDNSRIRIGPNFFKFVVATTLD